MATDHASHEHDDELFEGLDELAHEGAASFASSAEIPGDDEPLAYVSARGSLEDGFELDVDMTDARLA